MLLSLLLLSAASGLSVARESTDTLEQSSVWAEKILIVSSRDTISFNSSVSVSEALLTLPGLQVSDMGAWSGLKQVSFRGLGSAHTTIRVDGLRMVNVQSGQNDLGMLGINDFSYAVVDYATNSVSLLTRRPVVSGVRASASVGMFNTYQAHAEYGHVFGRGMAIKASATGLYSKGDFPYSDSLRREGSDIRRIQAGVDFFSKEAHVKAYLNASDRGTPGSVYYPSQDRQTDYDAFIQGRWNHRFGKVYSLGAAAKFSFDKMLFKSSYGDSVYDQYVGQATLTNRFRANNWLWADVDIDFECDYLSTAFDALRTSFMPSAAVMVDLPSFKASFNILWQLTKDRGNDALSALSPALELKYIPVDGLNLTAFSRRAYRMPTFNELYYIGFGNPQLKSEDAWLSDIGISYERSFGAWRAKASANAFYNYLKDKIISAPTEEDPNIWLPFNVGVVKNPGVDVSAAVSYSANAFVAGVQAKYTFMNAKIPYVPRHSATVGANVSYKSSSAVLTWNLRADRRDSYSEMPSWNTLDLSLKQDIGSHVSLFVHGRNLTNRRYEISAGYPMPGISVLGGIELRF